MNRPTHPILAHYYEMRVRETEAASEAYLRTPEGEAERQAHNQAVIDRMQAAQFAAFYGKVISHG